MASYGVAQAQMFVVFRGALYMVYVAGTVVGCKASATMYRSLSGDEQKNRRSSSCTSHSSEPSPLFRIEHIRRHVIICIE